MDEKTKAILRDSVMTDTLKNVQDTFDKYTLVQDESFFDYTLLKTALKRQHIGIVNFLLKLGCRVTNPNIDNLEETAFYLALKIDNAGIVRKMLKNGASTDLKNREGETALYAAFIGGHKNAVQEVLTFISTITRKHLEELLESNFKGPDTKNVDNIVHFQIACVTNHYDAVRYYLKYNFDVNHPLILNSPKFFGSNPLHYAAAEGFSEILEILLERGGDISIKNSNGQTPLQIIYYSSKSSPLKYLTEKVFHKGNNTKFINSVDKNGVSHFHMCCAINYPEYVQVFIDRGADVNSSISSNCSIYPGYTPLLIAVMNGCDKIVQLLLKHGADCKIRSTEGTTPLHLACKLNIKPIIQMLLKYNACPAVADKNGCTPLHLSFCNIYYFEDMTILDNLISKIPREVNFTDNQGLSHFHIVCIRNNISRVNEFLQSGVDINSSVKSKKYSGYTALHFAVLYNHKDIVKELLKWNAQVNIKTKLQLTPLHLACDLDFDEKFNEMNYTDNNSVKSEWDSNCKNRLDIVKLLLLYGADVDARDFLGRTPLLTIGFFNYDIEFSIIVRQIIQILLLNKANINAYTNKKRSILHIMSENPYFEHSKELVEYLLNKGANVHAVDNAGLTPLHCAVKSLSIELVKIFLKHQADVNAKSNNYLIPIQMIINRETILYSSESVTPISLNDIVSILLENGSYVNIRHENSKTLLQTAIECQEPGIIKKLLYYGADINMEGKFGNAIDSYFFDLGFWKNNETYVIIFQTIFVHMLKLLALGLYVSKKIQTCFIKLRQSYQSILSKTLDLLKIDDIINLDNVFDNCLEELDKMKLIKIDNYTSLYNILLKDTHEISKHLRNSTLIEIFEDPNVDNNFPLYSFLLKLKYKNGLKRSDVLKLAKAALHYIIKLNLPDLCYDSILKYLSNEDIINLKAAVKNNYKRKLNSDDSRDTEPSVKLAKH